MKNENRKRFLEPGRHLMMGNVAMSEGALSAGLSFFGGYPITPSTEVIEHLAKRLPEVGGVCMQMEDELASINSVIGASLVGAKAMTATSGPGLSLMVETISMAANLEIPFVFCDVQRNGPGTGFVTEPHHNDLGLVRFSGNGEFQVIALAPMTCQELFDMTITAFNFAETYRCPVFILSDAYLGHLHEIVKIPPKEEILERVIKRELPAPEDYVKKFTYIDDISGEIVIPKPPQMGTDYCPGLFLHQPHNYEGLPTPKPMQFIKSIMDKINKNKDKICLTDKYKLEDAEIIIIAYGLPVRASYRAVDIARKEGIKVGIFRLITVWPFPDEQVKDVVKDVKAIIVPELNYTGVMAEQVERVTKIDIPVIKIPNVCDFHHPDDILKVIREVAK
ncbi:MAG: 2-oxoacid:acceptor oxidoreductase subunit alpha [Candidatus Lokiarchaeota archaeon]|nr:2-oxoacid:acceptor oxidoreductase subunit alpha [Candidatus Lokiarchaeota archaeon]